MFRKNLLLCCLIILPFPFMNLMAQENGEKKIGSPKIDLAISAKLNGEDNGKKLFVSYTIKNLTGQKLFLFNIGKPYTFPREDKIFEIGQYEPVFPKGWSGPYIPRTEIPATIIKPQKTIEKTFEFAYPTDVFYPELMRLKMSVNGEIDSQDEKQTATPEKIQLCLGIASPSQTKPSQKSKKGKGFYSVSVFEMERQEIVCSDVIQLK